MIFFEQIEINIIYICIIIVQMIGQFLQLLAISVFTYASLQTFAQPLLPKDHIL